jgi:hypothetical protein
MEEVTEGEIWSEVGDLASFLWLDKTGDEAVFRRNLEGLSHEQVDDLWSLFEILGGQRDKNLKPDVLNTYFLREDLPANWVQLRQIFCVLAKVIRKNRFEFYSLNGDAGLIRSILEIGVAVLQYDIRCLDQYIETLADDEETSIGNGESSGGANEDVLEINEVFTYFAEQFIDELQGVKERGLLDDLPWNDAEEYPDRTELGDPKSDRDESTISMRVDLEKVFG